MGVDSLWPLFAAITGALYIQARRTRKLKRVFVPDYQLGLRFVKGAFVAVLGPGSYQPLTRKEQIVVVDMRPQPVFLYRISYRDAWQNDGFVSVAAELLVGDA